MGAVGSKVPLSIFDNVFWKLYLCHLVSKHRTQYQIERNCTVEILIDGRVLKMSKILRELCDELGQGIFSASTDF